MRGGTGKESGAVTSRQRPLRERRAGWEERAAGAGMTLRAGLSGEPAEWGASGGATGSRG